MKLCRRYTIVAVAIAMALCASAAHAAGAPGTTELAPASLPVPDGFEYGVVRAMSSSLKMVGFCSDSSEQNISACVWTGSLFYLLNEPDGVLDSYPYSTANGINSSRSIIGHAWDGAGHFGGFIHLPYYGMVALGMNGTDDCTIPCDINETDQVVGYSYNSGDLFRARRGFLWQNRTLTPITWTHAIDGEDVAFPIIPAGAPVTSINDAGQIVGTVWDDEHHRLAYHPVILWQGGVTTELNPGVGGTNARINSSGQVVADSDAGGIWLYTPGQGIRNLNVGSQYPTDLGNPDTNFGSARAMGFNDRGQVLIQTQDVAATPGCRLFLWQDDGSADGSFIEIPLGQLLESGDSLRKIDACLNSMGQVTGSFDNISVTVSSGFFWDRRNPQDLTILGAGSFGMYSLPTTINDLGVVAGYTNALQACMWDTRLPATTLSVETNYTNSYAFAINDFGQVVGFGQTYGGAGTDALIWQNGVMTALPLPEGCVSGAAFDIDALGQIVVGYALSESGSQACWWQLVDGAWTTTPMGVPEGYSGSMMMWINNPGQMVGYCYTDTYPFSAYYFQDDPGGRQTVLLYDGMPIMPLQMNSRGQIVGIVDFQPRPVVLWNPDGTVIEIGLNAQTAAINDLGQVVGTTYNQADSRYESFLYLPADAYGLSAGLHVSPADTSGWYCSFNDAGLVLCASTTSIGSSVSTELWFKDLAAQTTHYLGKVPGELSGTAKMNSSGQVCGTYEQYYAERLGGFYASIQDGLVFLGDLNGNESYALDINASGAIAGYAGLPYDSSLEENPERACVWRMQATTNHPPVADAGPNQALTIGAGETASVTLSGAGSSDPDGDALTYAWTEDGSPIATGISATVTLMTGTHTITLTVTDSHGATATSTVVVTVSLVYSWSGVLQPINPPNADGVSASVFKVRSTVPVKFALTDASAGITTLEARLSYAKVSNGLVGSDIEAASTAAATVGNLFRYDAASGQYIFNWSTKGLTSGTYRLFISLGDGVPHTVDLGLK